MPCEWNTVNYQKRSTFIAPYKILVVTMMDILEVQGQEDTYGKPFS